MKIKFKKYGKANKDDKIEAQSYFCCSCHDSIESHFEQIIKEDGKAVARATFYNLLDRVLTTEMQISITSFEEFLGTYN